MACDTLKVSNGLLVVIRNAFAVMERLVFTHALQDAQAINLSQAAQWYQIQETQCVVKLQAALEAPAFTDTLMVPVLQPCQLQASVQPLQLHQKCVYTKAKHTAKDKNGKMAAITNVSVMML